MLVLLPFSKGLGEMTISELLELLDRVEGAIRDYSEELVQQLARRDELEFEKEVKNSFIAVLIEVQNKQKEQRELMKRRRKEKGLSLQNSRIERATQMPLKVGEKSCSASTKVGCRMLQKKLKSAVRFGQCFCSSGELLKW